jgi:monoamine oxidase
MLEARVRAGGRIYSLRDPRAVTPIELGAEFIHGTPEVTLALLDEIGAARCDTAGSHAEVRGGRRISGVDLDAKIEDLLRHVDALDGDVSVDAFLRRFGTGAERRDAAMWMRAMVEGFDAADPAIASVAAIAQEWRGDAGIGGASSRPVGGYGPLVDHLLHDAQERGVKTLFGATVQAISRTRGGVEVHGTRDGEAFTLKAGAAIVTLPLGVLQYGDVVFEPALPAEYASALDRLAMGPVYKAVMVFDEPFWEDVRDGALRDAAFVHDDDAPFSTLWNALPIRSTTLVAWAGGPHASRLAGRSEEDLYEQVFASLDTMLGNGARERVRTIYLHDWQSDPFSRGAYSYVKVGGLDAGERLSKPLDGTLFFAGEATASGGEAGTVAGALQSGVRAAREVLAALQ